MYTWLTREERTQQRRKNGGTPFFNVIYKALSRFESKSLLPEDVWAEAERVVNQIAEVEECARDIEVLSFFEDLPSFYGKKKKEDMMLVMSVVYFMFLDKHDKTAGHPYGQFCVQLKSRMTQMPGFAKFFEICLEEIDIAEKTGCQILNEDNIGNSLLVCPEPCDAPEALNMDGVNMIVDEAISSGMESMRFLETSMSRANDKENNCLHQPLGRLRVAIRGALEAQNQPQVIHTDGGPYIAGGNFHQGAEIVTSKYLK